MNATSKLCAGIFTLVLSAFAQEPPPVTPPPGAQAPAPPSPGVKADEYAQAARQNALLLRQYSWTMRVAFTVQGEPKPARLFLLRYDLGGTLQKTALNQPEEPQKRGLRGRIAKKKAEEFQAYVGQLTELVKRYMAPSPGNMMDFYTKAVWVPQPDGTLKATAGGFLQPTDSVSFYDDPVTKAPRRFAFSTTLEQEAVNGQAEFTQIPGGPRYPARLTVDVPSKQIQVTVENFNFVRQLAGRQP